MSEQARHRLHNRLDEVLGADEAATLMERLMPEDRSELVTRGDVYALRADFDALRRDFDGVRAEWVEFRAEMRREFAEFKAEMRQEFAEFKAEIRAELAAFKAEIRAEMRTQNRNLFLTLLGLQISAAGLVVAVSKLV